MHLYGQQYRHAAGDTGGDTGAGDTGGDGATGAQGGDDDQGAGGDGGVLSAAGEWFYADGIKGEGDRPEFLLPKYKTMADQAKGYADLQTKQGEFGTYFGAPEGDYELVKPEGLEGEFDSDDPLLKSFQETAKSIGLSQEAFNKVVHGYLNENADMIQDHNTRVANVASELGENGAQVISDTWQRLTQVLPEEQANALDAVATDANAIRGLQTLLQSEAILPNVDSGQVSSMSRDDLRALRGQVYPEGHVKAGKQMYGDDKAHTKKVDELYKQRFPGDDVQVVNPTAG